MKRILLAALAAAVLPLAAQAGDLSYTYLQAGYDAAHNDNSGRDSHGWSGAGSVAVGNHFQVLGGFNHSDRDLPNNPSSSVNAWRPGAGFHTPVSGNTDFVADVDYHQASVDGVSRDTKRYSGELGVRSALAPQWEGWAMAGYEHAHDPAGAGRNNGEAFGKLGGQYKFTKNWGLVAEGRLAENDRSIFIGPRISF